MTRDGSLAPRDLADKLDVLRVACDKCGRSGRYRVTTLVEQIGWDGKLTNCLYGPAEAVLATGPIVARWSTALRNSTGQYRICFARGSPRFLLAPSIVHSSINTSRSSCTASLP
jgi:hypothetical protein